MGTTTTKVPGWVQGRILSFFNYAEGVDEVMATVKDDPSDGPGRTIGATLAARILRERQKYGFRGFTAFEQLDQIKGVGEGTIKDLVYTFSDTAAEAFRSKMYDDMVIYRENWPLEYFRYEIEDKEEFEKMAFDDALFRSFVEEKIVALSEERGIDQAHCTKMVENIKTTYIDRYNNSISAPIYALALWFYEFDADNWFSWERIQEATAVYFDHHAGSDLGEMELRFFKGFRDEGIIRPGITPDDLPVVINWAEQCVTLWFSALYD